MAQNKLVAKFVSGALAAVTIFGAVALAPAQAREHGYGYERGYGHDRHGGSYGRHQGYYDHRGHRGRDNTGAVVAAGVVGLAIGAIIGSSNSQPRYYSAPPAYYGPPPGYYQPRWCSASEWVWDPYIGRNVRVERSYRC